MKQALFAYLGVVIAATSLLAPGPLAAQGKPNSSASPDAATRTLTQCLLPKAQYSQLSSYDGGKSAQRLLEQHCRSEYLAFVTSCEAAGKSTDSCILSAAAAAQMALKSFGK